MAISSALGNAIVPTSYGFRNVIINGNFSINQRGYTSGSNLASGSYGFDRWKSNYTNTALTFTSAPQGQTVTISASGVVRQIVERANVQPGSYVLSWVGTATGRVYNEGASAPSYASGPLSVVLDGTANVIVEFTPVSGTATLGQVQLELGSRATPFEHRPVGVELTLCQRYYFRNTSGAVFTNYALGFAQSATVSFIIFHLLVPLRVAPTSIGFSGLRVTDSTSGGVACSTITAGQPPSTSNVYSMFFQITHGSFGSQFQPRVLSNDNNSNGFIELVAEL